MASLATLFQKYPSSISVATRMAQFILESNGGRSPLYLQSNNGFGIKASAPWQGRVVEHASLEANGEMEVSLFRAYSSLEEGIADHAKFFTSTDYRKNVVYKAAIEALDSHQEARALSGSYAVDPTYGDQLVKLIRTYDLTQYNLQPAKETVPISEDFTPIVIDRRAEALGGQAKDRSIQAITTIVWHYTAVKRSLDRKIWHHEAFWQEERGWDRGGYHYYIDSQANIYQNYDLERITWGVADCNHFCVHISVEANTKDDYSAEQIRARDWLTRHLMEQLKLDASAVKGHWEVNNNSLCPGYNKEEMDAFRRQLTLPSVPERPERVETCFILGGKRFLIRLVD
ncbi:hypothetical protein HF969_01185 [Facklamia miroungae]|nr:hypothetical protein [Facklamia miroungae]